MAKDPAFLFYSQDFLVGVMTMSFEDRGKYITILAMMHQQGRMNEETIRLLVGSFSDTLRLKFSVDEKGLFFNKRLEEETEKRNNFTKSRRDNGLKGGRPKKEKPNGKPKKNLMDNHKGNLMGNEIENENEVEILINSYGWNLEVWKLWIDYKKQQHSFTFKAVKSEKAALEQLHMLSSGNQDKAKAIILQSIANGWKGLFELKNTGNGTNQQTTTRLGENNHNGQKYKL